MSMIFITNFNDLTTDFKGTAYFVIFGRKRLLQCLLCHRSHSFTFLWYIVLQRDVSEITSMQLVKNHSTPLVVLFCNTRRENYFWCLEHQWSWINFCIMKHPRRLKNYCTRPGKITASVYQILIVWWMR